MSVVAYWPPEFQLWRSCIVAERLIRNRAAMIEAKGFSPPAVSSVALSTEYPAMTGTNLATTIWLMKLLKTDSMLASQLVPTDPLPEGTVTPRAAIHERSCGSVSKITVQHTHFPVLPLTWKLVP